MHYLALYQYMEDNQHRTSWIRTNALEDMKKRMSSVKDEFENVVFHSVFEIPDDAQDILISSHTGELSK